MTDTHAGVQTICSICFVCVLSGNQQLEDTHVDGENNQQSFAWSVLRKFYQKTKQLKDHLYLYTEEEAEIVTQEVLGSWLWKALKKTQ